MGEAVATVVLSCSVKAAAEAEAAVETAAGAAVTKLGHAQREGRERTRKGRSDRGGRRESREGQEGTAEGGV